MTLILIAGATDGEHALVKHHEGLPVEAHADVVATYLACETASDHHHHCSSHLSTAASGGTGWGKVMVEGVAGRSGD
jgi:hypothetical protein